MSTIQKLDPIVRRNRTARQSLLRFFERNRNVSTEIGKFCISGWAHMVALKRDSGSTGARKHKIAMRVHAQFDALQAAQPQ
jgi:hypothetical protein